MSYAIETKKRKFERILESLTDGPQNTLRTAIDRPRDASNVSSASSKRRRITPVEAPPTSLLNHYLPSSRPAFRERLETFRSVTRWHIPSTTEINAAEWAKRGWICVENDTVSCPSCIERVVVDLDTSDTAHLDKNRELDRDAPMEGDEDTITSMADAVYTRLIERYKDMIVIAHQSTCPWRQRGCDPSIQRIEGLLNTTRTLSDLRTRYMEIYPEVTSVSKVAELPLPTANSNTRNEDTIGTFKIEGQKHINTDILKLAICGWQKRDTDVLECHHCFRSLGLWLYRGTQPTMDQLDAVESHLEYCPWRCPEAQDIELPVPSTHIDRADKASSKQKVPGWLLVYQVMEKENSKAAVLQSRSVNVATGSTGQDMDEQEATTPDQRERKLNEIRRRIRDLKKPFNFKSLLRRKEKSVVS